MRSFPKTLGIAMIMLKIWQLAELAIPLLISIVGSLFADFINSLVITFFINLI